MPGPFPGMDPYLENPARWQETHTALITNMRAALNSTLPPPYIARAETRCYIGVPSDTFRPDLMVVERPRPAPERVGTVVADVDPSAMFRVYPQEKILEPYLDIINVDDGKRVVTTIELLSHTNKTVCNKGWEIYRQKQRDVLASRANLIEIDLLRGGRHVAAVPVALFRPENKYDYLVCLHRAGSGQEYTVWLTAIQSRLPRIAVPLDIGLPDVVLNLQSVFDCNYDEGAYLYDLDYTQEPLPALSAQDTLWADALLRERGLRP